MDLSLRSEAPMKPTRETLRPLLTGQAHLVIVTAFGLLDNHKARVKAYEHAVRASRLQAEGAAVTTVFKALSAAESAAPDDTRSWHAARVDAYAAEHGIKGWHRRTNWRGEHYIVADRLRLVARDGDQGRYYSTRDFMPCPPLTVSVVDRDSGRTAYRAINGGIAEQWIREHETAPAG